MKHKRRDDDVFVVVNTRPGRADFVAPPTTASASAACAGQPSAFIGQFKKISFIGGPIRHDF